MSGRSSHATPGILCRRGPIHDKGLVRSDHIGSVKMLHSRCCSSTVERFTKVTRRPFSTWPGGTDGSTSETKLGHGSGRLVSLHRTTLRTPGTCRAFGL